MVIRMLPPSKGGIYSNAGSSRLLIHYLEHEARQEKQTDRAIFFNQQREGIAAEEVRKRIDENIKGLSKDKPRFHSLVIAPSQDELRHLGNDPQKLTTYTRQVMENYAANFADRRQRYLSSDDLVWFATIHRSRLYSGLDDAVQSGQAQPGQRKHGEQMHVHVVVSSRDKTMSRSLHPNSGSRRFNYEHWLEKNKQDFEQTFKYRHVLSEHQHQQRLERLLNRLDRVGLSLDREQMNAVGQQHHYSKNFWKAISQMERGVKQGHIFTPNQAYEQLKNQLESKAFYTQKQKSIQSSQAINESGDNRVLLLKDITISVSNHNRKIVSRPIQDAASGESENATKRNNPHSPTENLSNQPNKLNKLSSQSEKPSVKKISRTDLSPLLKALRFESVPETGAHAQTNTDEVKRKLRRRR